MGSMNTKDGLIGFDRAFRMMQELDQLCGTVTKNTSSEEEIEEAKAKYFELYKKISTIIAYSPEVDVDIP